MFPCMNRPCGEAENMFLFFYRIVFYLNMQKQKQSVARDQRRKASYRFARKQIFGMLVAYCTAPLCPFRPGASVGPFSPTPNEI